MMSVVSSTTQHWMPRREHAQHPERGDVAPKMRTGMGGVGEVWAMTALSRADSVRTAPSSWESVSQAEYGASKQT